MASSVDVESLRDEFESSSEWRIRRKFLSSNCDSLSLDRLICLSRCFVNVAVYGCMYPPQVMRELNERGHGIVDEAEQEQKAQAKQNYSMSFVKASENVVSKTVSDLHTSRGPETNKGSNTSKRGVNRGIQFVKSSEVLIPDSQHEVSGNSGKNEETINSSSGYWAVAPSNSKPLNISPECEPISVKSENLPSISKQCKTEITNTNKNVSTAVGTSAQNQFKSPTQTKLLKSGPFGSVPPAQPLLSKDEYFVAWKSEKNAELAKFRKLAYEVVSLKSFRPNAVDKLHSAANRVPIIVEFSTESLSAPKNRSTNVFQCCVTMDGVSIASGQGLKLKDAKLHAYEAALQKVFMPYLAVVNLDPESKELQASQVPFTSDPPVASKQSCSTPSKKVLGNKPKGMSLNNTTKDNNFQSAGFKRGFREFKPIEDFVIIEPLMQSTDCTPVHTLRRSADFNHMLIEYDYLPLGGHLRCILKIENQILADVKGTTKAFAKKLAAERGLENLKQFCWVIKVKKVVDSDFTISKEEMLNELNEHSDALSRDSQNIGNRMLRKMGWSGGGVGKDGSGIAEPVSLTSVINREGLGLGTSKGITNEFRKRVRDVIFNYAMSSEQEDLMFSNDFSLEQRQVIHDECRKLHLRSKSRGKGQERYLCIHRKRTAYQLFKHIMSCGGETPKYKMVPPGLDNVNDVAWQDCSTGYQYQHNQMYWS